MEFEEEKLDSKKPHSIVREVIFLVYSIGIIKGYL